MGRTGEAADGGGCAVSPGSLVIARLARDAARFARPIGLDTQALIGYVEDREPIASLLARIVDDPNVPIVISTVSIAELLTLPARSADRKVLDTLLFAIASLPGMTVHSIDERTALETALVRAQTGLKLPDAAIVATARLVNALAIVGNDRQWRNRPLGVAYVHLDDIMSIA